MTMAGLLPFMVGAADENLPVVTITDKIAAGGGFYERVTVTVAWPRVPTTWDATLDQPNIAWDGSTFPLPTPPILRSSTPDLLRGQLGTPGATHSVNIEYPFGYGGFGATPLRYVLYVREATPFPGPWVGVSIGGGGSGLGFNTYDAVGNIIS